MKLEIDIGALERDIQSLQTMSTSLRTNLDQLTQSMESLNQTWEGPAKAVYLMEYQEDRENMQQVCEIVERFIRILIYAKEQYCKNDADVKSVIEQIRI